MLLSIVGLFISKGIVEAKVEGYVLKTMLMVKEELLFTLAYH
jgi:hypothetical protein